MTLELQRIPEELYDGLPLTDLAAYAMAVIEELGHPLTFENVTVALYLLFPSRFAMVGYPQYPDAARSVRTLLQMQPKYRNMATGGATTGYSLSPAGRRAAERLSAAFGRHSASAQATPPDVEVVKAARGTGRARSVHSEDQVARVRDSELFRRYRGGEADSARGVDFLSIVDAFSHTPRAVIRRRYNELVAAAQDVGDEDVLKLLKYCKQRFAALMAPSEGAHR